MFNIFENLNILFSLDTIASYLCENWNEGYVFELNPGKLFFLTKINLLKVIIYRVSNLASRL